MFQQIASMFGRVGGGGASVVPPSQQQITSLIGPPRGGLDPTQDHILSDIFSPPYRGPGELDNYGGETPEMRRRYRDQHRTSPVFRSAIDGKSDDISALKVTVQSADKDDPVSNDAAEFLDWTIQRSPDGWGGLIESIYRPATIDGWSLCEKKMRPVRWKGREMWGLAHVRSLDTVHMRLQLDVYRNVVGVVNILRGLEYYDPSQVIHYAHRGMFGSPFGQSDGRAATRGARMIEDVYRVWYVAMEVYGLPRMVGKVNNPVMRKQMETTLRALREGGWVVLSDPKDEIEILDLASSAAVGGFESLIRTQREDVFYAVRHASLPFMEGKGSAGSHGDTEVEQGTSDAGEKRDAERVANAIRNQLVPWIIGANFDIDEGRYPTIQFGGTNWKQIGNIIDVVLKAQDAGIEPSAEWVHAATNIPAARRPGDKLVTAAERQEKQQAQQSQQPEGGGLAALLGGEQKPPEQPPEPQPQAFSDAVRLLPTSRLSADPARFQFRHGHDGDDGTVRELPAEKFDPAKSPELLAWHDPADGEDYVVDGHHRLAWAERDGVKRVLVRFLGAKSADEAREMGRRANLNKPVATDSQGRKWHMLQAPAGRDAGDNASTFSDGHAAGAPTAEQMARVAERVLRELSA